MKILARYVYWKWLKVKVSQSVLMVVRINFIITVLLSVSRILFAVFFLSYARCRLLFVLSSIYLLN